MCPFQPRDKEHLASIWLLDMVKTHRVFPVTRPVGQQQPSPMAKVTPVDLNRNRPSYGTIDFAFVSLRARRENACGAQLLEVVLAPGCWSTSLCVDSVIHSHQPTN